MAASAYITIRELQQYALAAPFLDDVPVQDLEMAIHGACAELDAYAAAAHATPVRTLVAEGCKVHLARVAAYIVYSSRGFDPEGPDRLIVEAYERAIAYFREVGAGKLPYEQPDPNATEPTDSGAAMGDPVYLSDDGPSRRRERF